MSNIVETIKNFTAEDYLSGKVNLHIHTTASDGNIPFEEVVAQARVKGYKAFAVTDHNTVEGHIKNKELNVITGVEFDVWYKYIFLHLLAYGIDVNHPGLKPFYAKSKKETESDIRRIFANRNLKRLITEIHNAGGIAVLAHPACCWAFNLECFIRDLKEIGLDGVEVYYPYPRWRKYIKFSNPDKIENIANKYNLIKTGGTDFHGYKL